MWGLNERTNRGSSFPGQCRLNETRSESSDRFGSAPQTYAPIWATTDAFYLLDLLREYLFI
jgi:hypothetical protein